MACHIAQRLHILRLLITKLFLQGSQLSLQQFDIPLNTGDVALDSLNRLLVLFYLTVDDIQVVQPVLHIGTVGLQQFLLFLDLLLDLCPLTLQPLDLCIGIYRLLLRGASFLGRGCFLGGR